MITVLSRLSLTLSDLCIPLSGWRCYSFSFRARPLRPLRAHTPQTPLSMLPISDLFDFLSPDTGSASAAAQRNLPIPAGALKATTIILR